MSSSRRLTLFNSNEDWCAGCGLREFTPTLLGLYVPPKGGQVVTYVLCTRCSDRITTATRSQRARFAEQIERRLASWKGPVH